MCCSEKGCKDFASAASMIKGKGSSRGLSIKKLMSKSKKEGGNSDRSFKKHVSTCLLTFLTLQPVYKDSFNNYYVTCCCC